MNADIPPVAMQVYQLKVVLRDCRPLIWRRLLVTSDTSIAQLHAILQVTMGWTVAGSAGEVDAGET